MEEKYTEIDVDELFGIDRCVFCGLPIADTNNYRFLDHGIRRYAHTKCDGVIKFVNKFCVAYKLQKVLNEESYIGE